MHARRLLFLAHCSTRTDVGKLDRERYRIYFEQTQFLRGLHWILLLALVRGGLFVKGKRTLFLPATFEYKRLGYLPGTVQQG